MGKKTIALLFVVLAFTGFAYSQEYDTPYVEVGEDGAPYAQAAEVGVPAADVAPIIRPELIYTLVAADATPITMEVSAEMKTGIFWDNRGQPEARIFHNDDGGQSRLTLGMNFQYDNAGVRIRFQQDGLGTAIRWDFAYAYGGFFDNQIRLYAGRLGVSPFEWGGSVPRWIWVTHDHRTWDGPYRARLDDQFGIRTEFRPAFIPGFAFGFTFNEWDERIWATGITADNVEIMDFFLETVFGISYTNDHFHGRFSFRLDSEADDAFCLFTNSRVQDGHSLMYRIEPRFISNLMPGLSVNLHGWLRGLGVEPLNVADFSSIVGTSDLGEINTMFDFRNWLYIEFAPPDFIAELRLGVQITGFDSHVFTVRPSFFYNVLPFLRAGSAFRYEFNFGSNAGRLTAEDRPTPINFMGFNPPDHFFAVEPQVRFHFGQSYIALVYGFEGRIDDGDLAQRHWINLRAVISF